MAESIENRYMALAYGYLSSIVDEAEKRRAAILADSRLSEAARNGDLKDVAERTQQVISDYVIGLWAESGAVHKLLTDAEAKLAAAREKGAEGLDYSRLMYASERVPSLIARAQSPDELLATYEKSDAYLQRALSETGSSRVLAKWGSDAAGLAVRFKQDTEARQLTPEIKAATAELEGLQRDAAQLYKASSRALDSTGSELFSPGQRAMRSVRLDETVVNIATSPHFTHTFTWKQDIGGVVWPAGGDASQSQSTAGK